MLVCLTCFSPLVPLMLVCQACLSPLVPLMLVCRTCFRDRVQPGGSGRNLQGAAYQQGLPYALLLFHHHRGPHVRHPLPHPCIQHDLQVNIEQNIYLVVLVLFLLLQSKESENLNSINKRDTFQLQNCMGRTCCVCFVLGGVRVPDCRDVFV